MINVHESTLALSVYNALRRCGALTPERVITFLRRNWEPEFEAADLGLALKYLQKRGLVTVGETIAPTGTKDGAAVDVIRNPKRETELVRVEWRP
jgi:hypothetical protein